MKYLSLFTGIGGFELGIQQAYVDISKAEGEEQRRLERSQPHAVLEWFKDGTKPVCVGYSEIDKYAVQIYQKHFNHKNYGDITKISAETLPDFDLLVGGFPCQSFSIAGKRRGFQDTRGTLFFDIVRIIKEKQPRLLLLENVKGLLSHDQGKTFYTIISALDELGYDLQWQVLNSKNFGVPQNRERVFIVGHLRGTPRPEVFPIGESGSNDKTENDGQQIHRMEVSEALDASYGKGPDGKRTHIQQINNPKHSNDRVYSAQVLAPTLNTMQGGRRQPKIVSKTVRSGRRSSPHGSKQNWDSYEFEGRIRRLTPKECERLQGFPDGWTTGISDTQRYKCLGNAVTVNVVKAIAEELLAPAKVLSKKL